MRGVRTWCMDAAQLDTTRKKEEVILKTSLTIRSSSWLLLDRVEAWPVELVNSTGWSSRWSSWSSRWLPPSSFAYPVELRPCTKSFLAPHVPYAPKCSKRPIPRTKHACMYANAT
ncbi:unnamed protein product [Microthlaspi erraticum]|uniref:Uncharacterized protein n=1 Tax=Microthlaspi erraticum TaxID=1685480 RepID=A0A6D2K9R6_9BRAS|nr:unnamed protein product [Microthlaspi erraticum]